MNPLRKALNEYLAVRRALGFELHQIGAALQGFVSYLDRLGTSVITSKVAVAWAKEPVHANPARWAKRLGWVRRFAQFRSGTDPRTEIPPQGLLPYQYRRQPPYIYSDLEVDRLVKTARTLPSVTGLRPHTYSTFFGLMAVTGMRVSEARGLDREDVDLKQGMLTIRRSKFRKARLVPFHPSTQAAMQRYALIRDRLEPRPKSPSFFLSEQGTRPSDWAVHSAFLRTSRQIGLRRHLGRRAPRLHDLRHRFAVRTLLGWYRKGHDAERRMPLLATYLGHSNILHTYWYLSATPELLGLAARRLEQPGQEVRV